MPSMLGSNYISKCISNQPFRSDNAACILKAGNTDGTVITENLTEIANNWVQKRGEAFPGLAVSPVSSGNLGTAKAISGTKFCYQGVNEYQILGFSTLIGGSTNNIIKFPAGNSGRRWWSYPFYGYQRLHITSWNAQTGAATKGAANGQTIKASGITGGIDGINADDAIRLTTYAVPGELAWHQGALNTATQLDYPAKTSS